MYDDFGVGTGMEAMIARFEAQAQFLEVINLTIEHHPNRSVFITHRFAASGRYVDDGKSIVGERDVLRNDGRREVAEVKTIWASMPNRAGHSLDRILKFGPVEVLSRDSGDSAHTLRPLRMVTG